MPDHPYYDALYGLLTGYAPKARVFASPHLCGNWQGSSKINGVAMFHLVGAGQCWLHLENTTAPATLLREGDLIFLPHGTAHWLSAAPTLQGTDDFMQPDAAEGVATDLVCGVVEFGISSHHCLLEALPDMVLVPHSANHHSQAAFHQLLRWMYQEAQQANDGGQMVLDKLSDVLFVMVLRYYLEHTTDKRGVLAALSDTRLRPVITALHQHYGQNWQIDKMTALACMSRTAFMRHFKAVLGVSPQDYLTCFRMNRAEVLLLQPGICVADIAEQVGYQSEAAFRRAFKRHTGRSPGRVLNFG